MLFLGPSLLFFALFLFAGLLDVSVRVHFRLGSVAEAMLGLGWFGATCAGFALLVMAGLWRRQP
jgi:hypothetical protein